MVKLRNINTLAGIFLIIILIALPFTSWNLNYTDANIIGTVEADNIDDLFGFAVDNAGDVNGDGVDDIIVGAPGFDNDRGRAYIFLGGSWITNKLSANNANVTINGTSEEDKFGWDVSGAGDFNNDGYDDVIISAPDLDFETGAVYLFYGSNSLPVFLNISKADIYFSGESNGDLFGTSISDVDDINNDGLNDILISAPGCKYCWNNNWEYRKKLIFNNSGQSESLINFPILVILNSLNFDYSKAKPDGTDLRFFDDDGDTELNYHIELWDPLDTSYIWVNVTNITGGSSTDHIWMYYGNPGAVDVQDSPGTYENNFIGVWHLNETAGAVGDATGKGHSGTAQGGLNMDAVGKIDGTLDFAGDDDWIDFGTASGSASWALITGDITLEAWINIDSVPSKNRGIFQLGTSGESAADNWQYEFILDPGGGVMDIELGHEYGNGNDQYVTYNTNLDTGIWYYLTATRNASLKQWRLYVDGSQFGSLYTYTNGPTGGSNGMLMAFQDWFNPPGWVYTDGKIDEIRMSTIPRSSDWIKAQYLSMSNSYITYGNEESGIESGGAAFVFYGQKGLGSNLKMYSSDANVTLKNNIPNCEFGFDVNSAGDFNQDNYDDIIVGAPGADRAYIYFGNKNMNVTKNTGLKSPSALGSFNNWVNSTFAYTSDDKYANSTETANSKQDWINFSFGLPQDITILGIEVQFEARAPYYLNSEVGVRLSWDGGVNIASYNPKIIITSANDNIYKIGGIHQTWGRSWKSSEFSNENFSMRLMKYPGSEKIAEIDQIQIQVYYAEYESIIIEESPGVGLGMSVTGCGDINGDNINEIFAGAPLNNSEQGTAYLFSYANWESGTILNPSMDSNIIYTGENPGDRFGYSLSGNYNFNGDSYSDIFIGAPNASLNGKIYGFYGGGSLSPQLSAANADYIVTGENSTDQFGLAISSTGGNFDNKWYDEVIVGAPYYNFTGPTGKTYMLTYDKILDIEWVKTFDENNFEVTSFTAGEDVYIRTNVGGPFGSYDVNNVNITIKAPNGTALVDSQLMSLKQQDPNDFSSWKLFEYTFNNPIVIGIYSVDVTAYTTNGLQSTTAITFNVVPGQLHHIDITPSSIEVLAGSTENFVIQGFDQFNNNVPISGTVWSTTVGTISGGTDNSAILNAQTQTAIGFVNATVGSITASADVTIIPDLLDHILVSPDKINITVDQVKEFAASGYDRFDNKIMIDPEWSTDLGVMNGSNFTAQTETGSGYVNATIDNITGSAKVNIVPGPLVSITVLPDEIEIIAGGTQVFMAFGYDVYGNNVSISPNWTTTVGIMNGSELFAQTEVSTGFVNASDYGIIGSESVTIIPGPIDHINITPEDIYLPAGNQQEFTATGYDIYNNRIDIAPAWSTDVGKMSDNILIAQISVGAGKVTATYQGITCNVNVTIVPGELDYIFVNPQYVELLVGQTQKFSAAGYDKYNNIIPITPTWLTDVGSMNGNEFTAQDTAAEGTVIASVILNSTLEVISGSAQVKVSLQNLTGRPNIIGRVPNQVWWEDCSPWILQLTAYESDIEDSDTDLDWYITGENSSLYVHSGEFSDDDILKFTPVPNAYGNNRVTLWLTDSDDNLDFQFLWINITPINDAPVIYGAPDLVVHYDDAYTFDFKPYVYDVESSKDNLIISTAENTEGDYTISSGLNVTFKYPKSMLDQDIHVRIIVSDGQARGEDIVKVKVTDNWVPKVEKKLPDITMYEGTILRNVFDLDDYFADPDKDALYYSYGQTHVMITIHNDHTVDVASESEWFGIDTVTFRAEDPDGALAEDTVIVKVLPINDPPVIAGVPDLIVRYDYEYKFNLESYIEDKDNETDELLIFSSDPEHIGFDVNNKLIMVLNFPESMNGLVIPITITVSDYLVSNWQLINITVSDDYPPEIHTPLPNIEFDEDAQKSNVFDLDDFFLDIDGDALFYTYGHTNIQVTIKSDNRVDFAATANWFGTEIVTFRAEDPRGALAEDSIIVNVLPVNDAPEIFDIPDQEGTTSELWTLDISSYITDIDNNITELQITVDNEYVVASGLNLVFYSEKAGSHQVTIGVNDGDKNATYTFNVKFNEAEDMVTIQNAIFWALVIILITTLCGSIYLFKRYRGSYKVDDAFLVYNDGTMISHKTNRSWENADEDLVTAMFTAVQEFVRSSFANATSDIKSESSLSEFSTASSPYKMENVSTRNEWNLKQLRLQDHDIFIEQGQYVYIAVIFTGTPGWDVHFKVKNIIEDIDTNYSDVLKNWSGDMRKMIELENKIDPLIKKGSLVK